MDAVSWIIFAGVNLVLAVLFGFIFGKTGILDAESKKIAKWLKYVIGIVVFGAVSIFGTVFGVSVDGPILNARDFGPLAGGLYFGPFIGLGSAIVGAGFRAILGGVSVLPCCISTICAGIIGSVAYIILKKKGKKAGILISVILTVCSGLIHMILIVLLMQNGSGAEVAFGIVGIGTLISITVCMFAFSLVYKLSSKKAEN